MKREYKITQYSEQASESKGVRAGMWAVVLIEEKNVAFADSERQAHQILHHIERSERDK